MGVVLAGLWVSVECVEGVACGDLAVEVVWLDCQCGQSFLQRGSGVLCQQSLRLPYWEQRCYLGYGEVSIEDCDAVCDDRVGLALEEALVGVADFCPEFKSVQVGIADEYRAVDGEGD